MAKKETLTREAVRVRLPGGAEASVSREQAERCHYQIITDEVEEKPVRRRPGPKPKTEEEAKE